MNIKSIIRILSVLWIYLGLMMLSCLIASFCFNSGDQKPLFLAGILTITIGLFSHFSLPKEKATINKREGYLIVALGWFSIAFLSSLPYYFSGQVSQYTDAIFEAVSGLTTTGATIFRNIESLPEGIVLWRSLTQWIGGMGIIVLTVAVFPLLGIAGIELFVAEAPGPTSDKIHPRISEMAKRLWYIYLSLTCLLFLILRLEGMSWFDSINHAFTTMATGGFSTKDQSIAYFGNPLIEYTIVLFMFIAGTNYTIIYFALKGRLNQVWRNDEYRFYCMLVVFLSLVVGAGIYSLGRYSLEESLRLSLFQVVSLITTTGYVTTDYTLWSPGLTMLFFFLLFVGACAGSTSGGIKLIRHLVFIKNTILEFKRILHPRALIRIKINKKIVAPRILTHILVFLLIYLILFTSGTLIMSFLGLEFKTAVGAVATSLGNVGPAIGNVGPAHTFYFIPTVGKWILCFLMLCGRLELFTVLVLFTPYFWKN